MEPWYARLYMTPEPPKPEGSSIPVNELLGDESKLRFIREELKSELELGLYTDQQLEQAFRWMESQQRPYRVLQVAQVARQIVELQRVHLANQRRVMPQQGWVPRNRREKRWADKQMAKQAKAKPRQAAKPPNLLGGVVAASQAPVKPLDIQVGVDVTASPWSDVSVSRLVVQEPESP
jgi:hypothetical protein